MMSLSPLGSPMVKFLRLVSTYVHMQSNASSNFQNTLNLLCLLQVTSAMETWLSIILIQKENLLLTDTLEIHALRLKKDFM